MRIDVSIEIKTTFTHSDTGYTRNMTLPEIEKWAKDKVRSLTVYLQEGGTDPKQVSAEYVIKEIRFTPEKEKD